MKLYVIAMDKILTLKKVTDGRGLPYFLEGKRVDLDLAKVTAKDTVEVIGKSIF